MEDQYMVVAYNPTVKKAISKEKQTKRGLVCPSDYYLQVARIKVRIESPYAERHVR